MNSGTRFVEIPASALLAELQSIADAVNTKGGKALRGLQGREVIFDFTPPSARGTVRVYTTLANGQDMVRECGEDAVRVVVGHIDWKVDIHGKFYSLTKPRKMLRTAPQGIEEHMRVRAFLDRLTEALRVAYGVALRVPMCGKCGKPMAERSTKDKTRRFYGCVGFPECRETRPIQTT